jgi:hypothetical protein
MEDEMGRLYVLVGLKRDGDKAVVTRFGPTSESTALLHGYEMAWPHDTERVTVLPVLRGGLLRVSSRQAARAMHIR